MKVGPFEVSGSYVGDCRDLLKQIPDESVQCCVTSPPYYGLRDYGVAGQIGLEASPDAYGRLWLGFDLNPAYHELQKKRTAQRGLCFAPVTKEGR